MEQLEKTKAKSITIPKFVKRYGIAYYSIGYGWQNFRDFFTTPESAQEQFLRTDFYFSSDSDNITHYKIYEVTLEIPVV